MKVLLIEDDNLIADLLETVISGLYVGVEVYIADQLQPGERLAEEHEFDLIVLDWNLPDGSGLDFVKNYRKTNTETPIVMVSSRNDKQSVISAVKAGINQYISKPFTVAMLHERLKGLLKESEKGQATQPLEDYLADHVEKVVQLPTELDPQGVLALIERQDELSSGELADIWRGEVSLTARLLDVANSSSFKRSGEPVEDLTGAINSLGVQMTLSQALALALDASNHLSDEKLSNLAKLYLEKSMDVAKSAQQLALTLNLQPEMFAKAGLLSRIGELAVLKVLNQYLSGGGELGDAGAEELVEKWAKDYGNKLKIEWNLPLELRDMIGAVHYLADGTVKRDRLVMRYAALKAEGIEDDEEYLTLQRRLGLEGSSAGPQPGQEKSRSEEVKQ